MNRLLVSICVFLVFSPSRADHPVTMWEMPGERNRIYLLGSVHLLRESDHPIPSVIYAAYDDAEALIMEIDLDDTDPAAMSSLILELGLNKRGETLRSQLGASAYSRAGRLARQIDISLDSMAIYRPWFAAVRIEVIVASRLGFDSSQGIEARLTALAASDGKNISGLETEREQMLILSGLSKPAQREMLLQVLADGKDMEDTLDSLIDAWRIGDVQFLEQQMLSDIDNNSELYDSIVVDRNKKWIARIEDLIDQSDDYLVVVGALHLVGPDGVPELLRERGYSVTQMNQASGR